MARDDWRRLELNGGSIIDSPITRFSIPAAITGYADAQIDDYGTRGRFEWRPGTTLSLKARFSHPGDRLMGTAGFGFWNAPYGDPSRQRPALPQAVWFFFASPPNDLIFAPEPRRNGWFAATIDAGASRVWPLIPLTPFILALNRIPPLHRPLWPGVKRKLGIDSRLLSLDMTKWHDYLLEWETGGCRFVVDGQEVLQTSQSPRGPLGFVCWLDNQYLILTPGGRFRQGVLAPFENQWLEIADLKLAVTLES